MEQAKIGILCECSDITKQRIQKSKLQKQSKEKKDQVIKKLNEDKIKKVFLLKDSDFISISVGRGKEKDLILSNAQNASYRIQTQHLNISLKSIVQQQKNEDITLLTQEQKKKYQDSKVQFDITISNTSLTEIFYTFQRKENQSLEQLQDRLTPLKSEQDFSTQMTKISNIFLYLGGSIDKFYLIQISTLNQGRAGIYQQQSNYRQIIKQYKCSCDSAFLEIQCLQCGKLSWCKKCFLYNFRVLELSSKDQHDFQQFKNEKAMHCIYHPIQPKNVLEWYKVVQNEDKSMEVIYIKQKKG